MVSAAKYIAASAVALALIGSPGLAKKSIRPAGADREFPKISAARGAALRECNRKAEVFKFDNYLKLQIYTYRACMFDHGQME